MEFNRPDSQNWLENRGIPNKLQESYLNKCFLVKHLQVLVLYTYTYKCKSLVSVKHLQVLYKVGQKQDYFTVFSSFRCLNAYQKECIFTAFTV